MDEEEIDGVKSPIKRLGSTRKLLVFNNIRLQLNEQLRCLDVRMEAQVALVAELQDFFRRRAELELDYSKSLDKMARSIQLRHKEQKQKREQWPLFSSYACWQQLVNETKSLSRDHAALSEVYSTHLVGRLNQVMEDVQRIYKRCREIGYETHEEILRVLHELHTTMKTYQAYQAESRQAETKLRVAEQQRSKLEVANAPPEKLARSKKYKLIEKEVNKRKSKYQEAKLKALKARNEYILCLEASNTTITKYFVDDLSDLIDCMDFGFHNCIARALLMHCSAEEGRQRSLQTGAEQLAACVGALDSRADKQRFLESHHAAFMIPKKFEFQGQRGDETPEPELQKVLHLEMEQRLTQLQQRVTSLRTESEEVWKTLETAEASLLEMLTAKDYDCSRYFGENAVPTSRPPETLQIKLRADRQETEEFYLTKFREYLLGTSRIARLDAKQEYIRQSLLDGSTASPNPSISTTKQKQARRKRIGRLQMNGQPKLFGGSLEEYLESTNQEIPLIMKSCIRVINLYGLHHQGIFRVSGSQVEINNFREWFERGEDPLADVTDASDINSVAGVLKLYLRELREPLFPIIYFEHLMELAQLESKQEFVNKMKELIASLPRPVVIVMRYLFAFLNHLSEFSDENMMDPYNLAICFGPTLVPVPEDKDQVQYQNQVNELIKNIITFCEEIFPEDIGGTQYEKYISREPDDADVGDSPTDQVQEDMDSEVYPSEDESENLEATAQFDFNARSERELSFKKGDTLTLFTQVSNDWWRGSLAGREGLIPDKYIMLKIKDEEREKELLKSSSEESMRRRASSSADSVLPNNNSPLMMSSTGTSNAWSSTPVSDISLTTNTMSGENNSTSSGIVPATVVTHVPCISSAQPIISREESTTSVKLTKVSTPENENISENLLVSNSIDLSTIAQERMEETEEAGGGIGGGGQGNESGMKSRGAGRKQHHWKSQSVGESTVTVTVTTGSDSHNQCNSQNSSSNGCTFPGGGSGGQSTEEDIQHEQTTFSANRELWQRRATSQTQLNPPIPPGGNTTTTSSKSYRSSQEFREMRQKQTPDLVMDLPLSAQDASKKSASSSSLSSSDDETSVVLPTRTTEAATSPTGGPESPDMSTAAERFAKQNQCTLKKNTKTNPEGSKLKRLETADHLESADMEGTEEIVRSASTNQISDSLALRSPLPPRSTPKIVAKFADMHLTGGSQVSSFKPQVKVKPTILRKPVLPFPHPHMSPELARKIEKQAQSAEQAN
ncbi:SLIT-ROBO Rho GTPase-activating protein 1-like isoform X1 [Vespula pensylvanica]|uniref:SLIT-ROBO Rho GTPase-activating protein 1-like isoform X1 n=2 Tax=Vespula pensylvanica TaxID=30213 RepID=UPI001CBA2DFD|nr:SLIT-ROBO Rho GTPase-activating protein 1-like isoform X1 [Vespula pensylvanica]XP_043684357.1 SLIT-ROBO Rho GTPase-activating protein 1-like isoform X1 [Vespula pensylvanica]XP_043684358.1 SLIT-ROBO Rho GTPase-activating protein 1-like isoform X1 [Vespula pensylvanica]XP_043684359.1 SLIT-ROBO Rho GTPase-activating protein 1-like isoform X1 [Vespula pensylvanica]XP_043684360.1 SLIT-ROBO Rho GTPase-activating protein 1-like isoform X1 [Vespula pensylvanica]XP_043684361.1 SLIT-ROBO Rho GTPase